MKRKMTIAASALAALLVASAAFAYFTNDGSGTGPATVGTSEEIQLDSDNVQYLYPGGADVPVTVNIHNQGEGVQYVGTVSGVVETDDNGTEEDESDDCLGSWFEVDDVDVDAELGPDGSATDSTTADTDVRMLNESVSQDACKDDVLTISWTSNSVVPAP